MATTVTVQSLSHPASRIRIIPQRDPYPRLVSFGQTLWGKAALLAAFAGALIVNQPEPRIWIPVTLIVAVMSFLPQYRRPLLSLAAVYWILYGFWMGRALLRQIAQAER